MSCRWAHGLHTDSAEPAPAGQLHSDNVMVKHSNEYRAPAEGHTPEQLYQTLIREDGP